MAADHATSIDSNALIAPLGRALRRVGERPDVRNEQRQEPAERDDRGREQQRRAGAGHHRSLQRVRELDCLRTWRPRRRDEVDALARGSARSSPSPHPSGARSCAPSSTACLIVCAFSNDPITAMPSAAPTWRTVVLVPLATPALSVSMSERITLVSCELAKPTPIPKSTDPGSSASSVVFVEIIERDNGEPDRLEHEADPHHARRCRSSA